LTHNELTRSSVEAAYLDRLLAALPERAAAQPQGYQNHTAKPAQANEWFEPLSGRETEVLHLLNQGLTNAQIAERLYITTGTVKAHTANIFRKLDAANRTQAVSKGRAFGLLK
jgi:LuxR family transcriptional regulator, maltose regulon positive regulatory protein